MRDSKTRNRFLLDNVVIDGEPEENDFYEGYLNDVDSQYVGGFDWNTEMCVNGYFNDTDQIKADISKILGSDQNVDAVIAAVRDSMMKYIEAERDSLITSLINNMSEAEFEYMKRRYNEGDYNYVLKQNCKVFELADESGDYSADFSDYIDVDDLHKDLLLDTTSVFGNEREYCAECICRDTCLRKTCVYDK